MSDDSLVATISQAVSELVRRTCERMEAGSQPDVAGVSRPVPFSRAEGTDYLRIVELWNAYQTQIPNTVASRACPACRATDSHFEFRSYDHYDFHACRQCGTWFVPLQIEDSLIEEFFSAVPEARALSDKMMRDRDLRTREDDRSRFTDYFSALQWLMKDRKGRLRYLDIGCGVGHSVELADEWGWEAQGVELSRVAVETARAKGRNVIFPQEWDAASKCDIVSLFETLEHLTDPDFVISRAAAALAPGGVLIMTMPNRSSFEVSILRERCFHVFGGSENVGHINLFGPDGLAVLLERHGLKMMHTDGQFGSDFSQILGRLLGDDRRVPELVRTGALDLRFPEPLYALANTCGPALTVLERVLKRSPILIAIACRAEDETMMREAFEGLRVHLYEIIKAELENI